ncbi:hypothetical protein B0H14DRAFT_3489312 [Mycena olivaceomarginata]|nr:hypothetical protein B0H14DRAFT_3489312 [Mycena olivaceomarginata]
MAPHPWTTPQQRTWLESRMANFIQRQAEGKLHLFWPPMMEAWFTEFPEHEKLGLSLPTDQDATPLTEVELASLGAAIKTQRSKLENWFRNKRKKISKAGGNAASSAATNAKVKQIFQQSIAKRVRAHQPVEIFQKRNGDLIKTTLQMEGYDLLKADSDTEEDNDTEVARGKCKKAKCMRLRAQIVAKLWEEVSAEERKAVEAEVEEEKRQMAEEALQAETRSLEGKTPLERQQGINVLDGVYCDIHKATYAATGWVGMSIFGGPNPRMGGDLTLKIVCFGETPGGNDFEKSCVDFDQNVMHTFQAFLQLCFSRQDTSTLSLPAADVGLDPRPVERIVIPLPIPEPEKPKAKKSSKSKSKKTTTLPVNKGPLLPPIAEPDETETLESNESVPRVEEEDNFTQEDAWTEDFSQEDYATNSDDDDADDDDEHPASDRPVMPWPAGMTAPLTPAEAAAIAAAERGGAPNPSATMAIDPRLQGLSGDTVIPYPVPLPPTHPLLTTPPHASTSVAPTVPPAHVFSSTNNNRKRALEAAEVDRAAKEQEVAAAKAKQIAKGWVEKTVDGSTVVTLLPARVQKAAKLPDGSAVPRAPDAKLDASDVALLARQKNAPKAAPKMTKRKAAVTQTSAAPQKRYFLNPLEWVGLSTDEFLGEEESSLHFQSHA